MPIEPSKVVITPALWARVGIEDHHVLFLTWNLRDRIIQLGLDEALVLPEAMLFRDFPDLSKLPRVARPILTMHGASMLTLSPSTSTPIGTVLQERFESTDGVVRLRLLLVGRQEPVTLELEGTALAFEPAAALSSPQ